MTHQYTIYTSPQGFSTIKQLSSNEIMHPCGDPYQEAVRLYVDQSKLAEILSTNQHFFDQRQLTIWDVGLGAACNAMAALHCALNLQSRNQLKRPLNLVSFEINTEPLELVLSRPDLFQYANHPSPNSLISKGYYQEGLVRWTLLKGDYTDELLNAPAPDLIFYDPFSYKTEDAPLWSQSAFRTLTEKLNQSRVEPTYIYTYSRATRVRAQLLAQGFYVAKGTATGAKSETTVAVHLPPSLNHPNQNLKEQLAQIATQRGLQWLDHQWLARWNRSHIRTGPGGDSFDNAIKKHPQFVATQFVLA